MIKFEYTEAAGFEPAMRGMRNPMNSWDRGDTVESDIGPNDMTLAKKLIKGGPCHRKFMRQIVVWVDITAPLYWWKEFDTYKIGTVGDSCSTMHKLGSRDLTIDDFSCEYVEPQFINDVIRVLNDMLAYWRKTNDKNAWYSVIQMLPEGYMQKRTIMLSEEVLLKIYKERENHKLEEWREFIKWAKEEAFLDLFLEEESHETIDEN